MLHVPNINVIIFYCANVTSNDVNDTQKKTIKLFEAHDRRHAHKITMTRANSLSAVDTIVTTDFVFEYILL